MKFKIIGTGSTGNSFLFEKNLVIDMGLSWKLFSSEIKVNSIDWVLLTHIHADHFKASTVRKFAVNNEKAVFICGYWMFEHLEKLGIGQERILIVEYGKLYQLGQFKISPVKAYHDVPNCGYRLLLNGHKHFHITDASTLKGITALDYDTASIECNHCVDAALKIIEKAKQDGNFTHLPGAMNSHLSVQQTLEFVSQNRIKKLIPIHMGASTMKEVNKKIKESGN